MSGRFPRHCCVFSSSFSALMLFVCLVCILYSQDLPAGEKLIDFSSEKAKSLMSMNKPENGSFVINDNKAEVTITPADFKWPGVFIKPEKESWDLSKYTGVCFELENPGTEDMVIVLRVDNDGDYHKQPWNTGSVKVPAGKSAKGTVFFGLNANGKEGYALDPAKVSRLLIFLNNPSGEKKFNILGIEAVNTKAPKAVSQKVIPGTEPEKGQLFSFAAGFDAKKLVTRDTVVSRVERDGAGALELTTGFRENWPGIDLPAPGKNGWDLSKYDSIAMDVKNTGENFVTVFLRVDNKPYPGNKHPWICGSVGLLPNENRTLYVPLNRNREDAPQLSGMRVYPPGMAPAGKGEIIPESVVNLVVFINKPSAEHKFEISNIRCEGNYSLPEWAKMNAKEFFPFIDKFGQFKHKDWPGKVKSEAELIANVQAEEKELQQHPRPPDWDKYGGYKDGPQLEASGRFRVQKYKGRWWFVDPDGRLFFSHGITCVGDGSAAKIGGYDNYYENLPDKNGENSAFYHKSKIREKTPPYKESFMDVYDFFGNNLKRKYGENWKDKFRDIVHRRLSSWGINTIANWSSKEIYNAKRTPYTSWVWYLSPILKGKKGKRMPDPFSPEFEPLLKEGVEKFLGPVKDDPWCIGTFIDNELDWGNAYTLAYDTLRSPATQPAKIKMVEDLKKKYGDIEKLNEKWKTNIKSWQALLNGEPMPLKENAGEDLKAFSNSYIEKYFQTCRKVLKTFAPQLLYFGCRLNGDFPAVVPFAAKYCDVISFNLYRDSVAGFAIAENIDKPVIVGEWHFGARDRGLFCGGLREVGNQEERGRSYAAYVKGAVDNPLIVGTHWFQFIDEPVTGRGDGENYQIGFLDVADTPYAETIDACRSVGYNLYGNVEK